MGTVLESAIVKPWIKPSLIEMNIIDEDGAILKTISFYDNSDNLTAFTILYKFIQENKGEYSLEIHHFQRI